MLFEFVNFLTAYLLIGLCHAIMYDISMTRIKRGRFILSDGKDLKDLPHRGIGICFIFFWPYLWIGVIKGLFGK